MPYRPRGTRVSVTIPTDLAERLANHPKVAAELVRVGREIGARADATVPVGGGTHDGVHLRETRQTEVIMTPKGPVLLIGYTAWWAHFVHNGTVHQPAQPWLLNAALSVLVTGRVARRAA
jgi:hypothetical protein